MRPLGTGKLSKRAICRFKSHRFAGILALEPGGDSWVETLPRRGYRYVGPVAVKAGSQKTAASLPVSLPVVLPPPLAPTDKPSIIVLPFQNLSGDPAQSYLGEGFAEDITTAMSRLKWLAVVARDSTDPAVAGPADLQSLTRASNIQYVLAGSTRLSGDRLRVGYQVIASKTWQTIFSEKYDRNLGDIFTVQDEITENLIAVIDPSLLNAEELRAAERPIERLDCWGLIARAVGLIHRFEREANATARAHLLKAIELNPESARAHATLGWALYWATHCSWVEDRPGHAKRAMMHAQTALHFDPQEPWARAVYGFIPELKWSPRTSR